MDGADGPGRVLSRQQKLRSIWETVPFNALCGFTVADWNPDQVTLSCAHRPQITNGAGTIHGGLISALVDAAATGVVVAGRADDDRRVPVTLSVAVNYVGAGGGDLLATATVSRRGRSACFVKVAVTGAAQRLVADAIVSIQLR